MPRSAASPNTASTRRSTSHSSTCCVAWRRWPARSLRARCTWFEAARGMHGGRSYELGDRVRLRIEDVSLAQRKVLGRAGGDAVGRAGVFAGVHRVAVARRAEHPGRTRRHARSQGRTREASGFARPEPEPQAATLSRIARDSRSVPCLASRAQHGAAFAGCSLQALHAADIRVGLAAWRGFRNAKKS